ncbi:hypothetical protein POM88_030074 [Heracleum sosnowskyi]|uniref:DUF4216 domain-containing protein n=1 Tax=Heracleum sosnowskyi TaxID=360622 RepID=A0AAD8HVD2_9APIA|nr:hypothetical protein POM88_030074 [Heracleum sosnowskyi]
MNNNPSWMYQRKDRWTTVGHLVCPHCAHDHDAYNLSHGGKPTWFDNHRNFLPANHSFRKNKNWFTKGKTVFESAPPIRTSEDVWHEIESLGLMKITELGSDGHNAKIIKTYKCGWKRRRRAHGVGKTRYLDDREYTTANNYVLFNCPEVAPYIEIFTNGLREHNPHINGAEIDKCLESDFAMWFKLYAQNTSLVPNEFVRDLASGPLRSVRSVPVYYGSNYSETSNDYFGILEEILLIEYPRHSIKKTALFKCEWFDPTLNAGTKIHQRYNIVETRQGRLASCMQSESSPLVELPQIFESRNQDAYLEHFPEHLDVIRTDDIPTHLDDIEGTSVDLDDDEESPEEEVEIDSDEEEFSKTDESDFYDSDDA